MHYPDFFDKVPSITLQDPLSNVLGAFEAGEMEIKYLECVKLAGHSCPTVAGAYLMAQQGLKSLYGNDVPQRGSIEISMRDSETDGVTGVIAMYFLLLPVPMVQVDLKDLMENLQEMA